MQNRDYLQKHVPEWADEKRMNLYMQDFKSNRQVNPEDWDQKMIFWKHVFQLLADKDKRILVSVKDLKTNFFVRINSENQRKLPLGWQTIVQNLILSLDLVETEQFVNFVDKKDEQGFITWMASLLIKKPATWLWSKFSSSSSDTSTVNYHQNSYKIPLPDDKKFVVINTVKTLAQEWKDEVLTSHVEHVDLFKTAHEIKQVFPSIPSEEFQYVLLYLQQQQSGAILETKYGRGIRFFETQKPDSYDSKADLSIMQLKETVQVLESQIHQMQEATDSCMDKARELVRKKQKTNAKYELRRKKLLEEALEKRSQMAENATQLLHKIQDAKSDMEVLSVLQSGAHVLQSYTTKLQKMKPEEAIDSIAEIVADYSEIEKLMTEGMSQALQQIDDESIEEELMGLQVEVLQVSDQPYETKRKLPSISSKTKESTKAKEILL